MLLSFSSIANLTNRFKNESLSKSEMPKYEKIIGAKTNTVIITSVGMSRWVSFDIKVKVHEKQKMS